MLEAAAPPRSDRPVDVREACHRAVSALAGKVLPHDSPHSDYAFGLVSYLAADLGEAVTSLERSQRTAPSPRGAFCLGLAHAACNRWGAAAEAFLASVEEAPDLLEGYYQAAGALRRDGRGAAAVELLERAAARFEGTSWQAYVLNELGVTHQALGDDAEADRCFREALRLPGGDRVAARTNLALVLERGGRGAEARELLEQVLEDTARLPVPHAVPRISFLVYYLLGNLELADGRPLRACRWYERSLEVEPQAVTAWNSLAVARHAAGWRRKAADALHRALAVDPRYAPARRNLESLTAEEGGR